MFNFSDSPRSNDSSSDAFLSSYTKDASKTTTTTTSTTSSTSSSSSAYPTMPSLSSERGWLSAFTSPPSWPAPPPLIPIPSSSTSRRSLSPMPTFGPVADPIFRPEHMDIGGMYIINARITFHTIIGGGATALYIISCVVCSPQT